MQLLHRCEKCGALVVLFRGDPSSIVLGIGPGSLLERIALVDDGHKCTPAQPVNG